jgi:hypothetical protein
MDLLNCALKWWNELPDYGAKDCSFDDARFKTKGGLTKLLYDDKFHCELTDDEIIQLYTQYGKQER